MRADRTERATRTRLFFLHKVEVDEKEVGEHEEREKQTETAAARVESRGFIAAVVLARGDQARNDLDVRAVDGAQSEAAVRAVRVEKLRHGAGSYHDLLVRAR